MMKKTTESVWLLLIAIVFVVPSYGQIRYPFYDNAKKVWGYSDSLGNILVKPQFDSIRSFYHGYAPAKSLKGWGVINEKGSWVIKPQYQNINNDYYNHLFFSTSDGKKLTKYIRNGKLLDKRPEDELDEPIEDTTSYPYIPMPEIEVRRFYDHEEQRWQLGRFYIRPGKSDSLAKVYSISSAASNFTEPIKKGGLFIAWFHSNRGKAGLLLWSKYSFDRQGSIVYPTYDSIWPSSYDLPMFYGTRNSKIAFIRYNNGEFKESDAEFDQVRDSDLRYLYLARKDNLWYKINYKFEKEALTAGDIDDIYSNRFGDYFFYKKNGLMGLLSYRFGKWERHAAGYTTIKEQLYWLHLNPRTSEYYLFEVTTPDGKKGFITTGGVRLFR